MRALRHPVRILVLVGALVAAGLVVASMINPRQGYAPQQPIYFQHQRMAGKPNWVKGPNGKDVNLGGFGIPCRYCHAMPYVGRHSTLPSTDVCMNCHSVVGLDKEWVLTLQGFHERGEPIPWIKVHDLPDFVYYDHSAHLNALDDKGKLKLDCVNCHGENIAETQVVAVSNAFNMGWCLDCHRKPDMAAPIDCIVCHR